MSIIEAKEAKIHTVTVEVQTIRIGGKQVTQSVFRQLKDESLFLFHWEPEWKVEMRGDPWGTVNYCPGKSCRNDDYRYSSRHLHVVWQKGSELRKATVFAEVHKNFMGQYEMFYGALEELPQLFIAV